MEVLQEIDLAVAKPEFLKCRAIESVCAINPDVVAVGRKRRVVVLAEAHADHGQVGSEQRVRSRPELFDVLQGSITQTRRRILAPDVELQIVVEHHDLIVVGLIQCCLSRAGHMVGLVSPDRIAGPRSSIGLTLLVVH